MIDLSGALANGDFSSLAKTFSDAGFLCAQPCQGVLQLYGSSANRLRLILSMGIHGDETAPIELVAQMLNDLSTNPKELAVDLMLVIGNLPAIQKEQRYIDVDLNRLFIPGKTANEATYEAQRADELMRAATQFFDYNGDKWHLDLHTAIRPSRYRTFAVVPGLQNPNFIHWLTNAGIDAILLHPHSSGTFSSYTCTYLGAVSCTAELGRIGRLGHNDLSVFDLTGQRLAYLLRTGDTTAKSSLPVVFTVAQELIKHSDKFTFMFDADTQNFTEFAPHTVLARDGDIVYQVGDQPACIVFPNADVQVGMRAGLMVVGSQVSDDRGQ